MLAGCVILSSLIGGAISAHHPSVKVSLLAKMEWQTPSFELELINLIHEQGGKYNIFNLIPRLKQEKLLGPPGSNNARDLYSFCMSESNQDFFINMESKDLIKASLALHSIAPKIQAFYHYYEHTVLNNRSLDSSCSNWVHWGEKQICNPNELLGHTIDVSDPHLQAQLLFDIYYKPDLTKNIAIFYADVHSSDYMDFFTALKSIAETDSEFNFIMRFKPPVLGAIEQARMYLSGYGVEMAVKNTEYKAVDDRNVHEENNEASVDMQQSQDDSTDDLYEENPSIQIVSKGRIKSIASLAIAFALGSKDPFSSLVRISLEFPKVAHLLKSKGSSSATISRLGSKMTKTVTGERQLLYLNGIALDIESFNVFELIRMMKNENEFFSLMEVFGISKSAAFELSTSPPPSSSSSIDWGDCFNTKTDSTLWINDLEKDQMYHQFPKSLYSLLQQGYTNQLKYVSRNIFSAVFFIDFTNIAHLNEIMKIHNIIKQQAPLRFGVVPILNSESSEEAKLIALAVNEIRKLGGDKFFLFFAKLSAEAENGIKPAYIRLAFSETVGKSLDTARDDDLAEIIAVNDRLGISSSGAIFGNGHFFPLTSDWTEPLISTYFKMASYLTNAVMMSKITDKDDVYDHYMNLPNVYHRRHPAIFPNSPTDLDMIAFTNVLNFEAVKWLYSGNHETRDIAVISIIAYGDSSNEEDVRFLSESVDSLTTLQNTRLTIVDTSGSECRSKELNEILGSSSDVNIAKEAIHAIKGGDCSTSTSDDIPRLRSALKLASKAKGYFINGRKVSLDSNNSFSREDLVTLVDYEFSKRIKSCTTMIIDKLSEMKLEQKELEDRILCISSIISAAKSIGVSGNPIERQSLSMFSPFEGTKIHFKVGDTQSSKFQFVAAIQPISVTGQKILGVLDKLKRISGVSIEVYAIGENQEGDGEKLPLMRFYTFVMDTEPTFTSEGNIAPTLAYFSKLPTASLLTLGMDVPSSWLVRPKKSLYDLDNIKLSTVQTGRNLEAEFGLEYLLVQGHALDKNTQMPPRGLQFVLGTPKDDVVDESITMANLGYIQLKGAPGVWKMTIRKGRSSDVYKLDSLQSGKLEDSTVVVDSFEGVTLHPLVSKRPGMQDADVLAGNESSVVQNVWNNIKSSIFKEEKSKTVNVFTVASGHLYERFMAIMMLSVKKQSKHPVKFWLIENFLSPNFLEFLPHLARAFDFEYELVTYKWPNWLRMQTEKQRIIWGYKILFLDVLFPLSLEKVIFVDADQVVRTDLIELMDLDLKGAVYGYTPFCTSRTEMDGFRFWKGGYWESHLAGRPYHISALYVIDLVKFRALAAGDRLRQQYHMLSADKNSLANLDQDLPNNMIHEIPMFSLPQEWLWCETWCSDESLKNAKTIDLCNNPLTKEPKLERAKRILPEWVGLDDQVASVREAFQKGFLSSSPTSSKSMESSTESYEDTSSDNVEL